MSYRPICDLWLLARPKVKFYGAYPSGFLERARTIIGCDYNDVMLHVCSGKAKNYPFRGFGQNDRTVDIDESLNPDFVWDVREEIPQGNWDGIVIDPPYTEEHANEYKGGKDLFPNPNKLLKDCINAVKIGKKVGMLHYICPACPKNAKFVACIGVLVGFNNRIRCFSVYERLE